MFGKKTGNVTEIKGGDGKEFAPVEKPRPVNNICYPHECNHENILDNPGKLVKVEGKDCTLRCVDCGVDFNKAGDPCGPGTSESPGLPEPVGFEMSEGQYLVDLRGDDDPNVTGYKKDTANIIDRLIGIMNAGENEGAMRCAAVALSKYEEACMWAVKAVEKPDISV